MIWLINASSRIVFGIVPVLYPADTKPNASCNRTKTKSSHVYGQQHYATPMPSIFLFLLTRSRIPTGSATKGCPFQLQYHQPLLLFSHMSRGIVLWPCH